MPHKRSFDLRVNLVGDRLPTTSELGDISKELADGDVEKTFVLFYLPGMEIGNGAYATAHHSPDMRVTINEWALPSRYAKLLEESK